MSSCLSWYERHTRVRSQLLSLTVPFIETWPEIHFDRLCHERRHKSLVRIQVRDQIRQPGERHDLQVAYREIDAKVHHSLIAALLRHKELHAIGLLGFNRPISVEVKHTAP